MLDIAWSEMLIIGVVALVVIGPKDLPKMLRMVGQTIGKVRRMAAEFQGQVSEAIREAELDDVKKSVEDLKALNPANMIRSEIDAAMAPVHQVSQDLNAELSRIEAGLESTPAATPAGPAEGFPADPAAPETVTASAEPLPVPSAESLSLPEIAPYEPPAMPPRPMGLEGPPPMPDLAAMPAATPDPIDPIPPKSA
nr:Sec-independent protein translocase protein TatB [Prosthecomicrobium hirschii]